MPVPSVEMGRSFSKTGQILNTQGQGMLDHTYRELDALYFNGNFDAGNS